MQCRLYEIPNELGSESLWRFRSLDYSGVARLSHEVFQHLARPYLTVNKQRRPSDSDTVLQPPSLLR